MIGWFLLFSNIASRSRIRKANHFFFPLHFTPPFLFCFCTVKIVIILLIDKFFSNIFQKKYLILRTFGYLLLKFGNFWEVIVRCFSNFADLEQAEGVEPSCAGRRADVRRALRLSASPTAANRRLRLLSSSFRYVTWFRKLPPIFYFDS